MRNHSWFLIALKSSRYSLCGSGLDKKYDSNWISFHCNSTAATYGATGNAAVAAGLTTAGVVAVIVPATALVGREVVRRLSFDGPSPGLMYGNGRICQIRFNNKPVLRLDYHPYPGTGGESRLHLNIGSERIHIPLDPRSFRD